MKPSAALCVIALGALISSVADAQIIQRPRSSAPRSWATFGVGFAQSQAVNDGSTESTWEFGEMFQYRVALERAVDSRSSLGVTATFARPAVGYIGPLSSCFRCDA